MGKTNLPQTWICHLNCPKRPKVSKAKRSHKIIKHPCSYSSQKPPKNRSSYLVLLKKPLNKSLKGRLVRPKNTLLKQQQATLHAAAVPAPRPLTFTCQSKVLLTSVELTICGQLVVFMAFCGSKPTKQPGGASLGRLTTLRLGLCVRPVGSSHACGK